MAQKQGGKGKQSSPSRQASHKRAKDNAEKRRAARIERHARRMGLNKAQIAAATRTPVEYPARPISRPVERMVQSHTIVGKFEPIFPLHRVSCNGVILALTQHRETAYDAARSVLSGLPVEHVIVNPITGRASLVFSRGWHGETVGSLV